MKTRFGMLRYLVLACFTVGFSSHANAWFFKYFSWYQPDETIAEIVSSSGGEFDHNLRDYDVLLTALQLTGLDAAVADESADLTVFAPNDAAFVRLARDFGYEGNDEGEAFNAIAGVLTDLGDGDPIPTLTNILLYHVSAGSLSFKELFKGGEIDTLLDGATILASYGKLIDNDPEFKNPRAKFWKKGSKASNGKIYRLNRVLIPVDLPAADQDNLPTITGTVAASGGDFDDDGHDFDILLNAVLAAGLDGVLADPDGTFTVFAPNDYAFIRLARDFGYHGWDEAGAFDTIVAALTDLGEGELIPVLTNVLLYHVSLETLTAKDVLLSESIATALEGASLTPDGFRLVDAATNLRDPRLVGSGLNILTSNGRVHVINRVLVPVDL